MANETLERVTDSKSVRPVPITLISLWLLFGAFTSAWLIFRGYGASFMPNTVLIAVGGVVSLVCGIGLWLMKKWALYVYAIYGLLNQVALLALGRWNLFSLLVLVIIVSFGYRNLSKMS
jgi:hypothetical protein